MNENKDYEKYFRPSKLPVLNVREVPFIFNNNESESTYINIPKELLKTPDDTILNYFSYLREAANPEDNIFVGCGTLGNATLPYPIAYQFLSPTYQQRYSLDEFKKSFQNILHINLLKYRQIPVYQNTSNMIRYFVEFETIEGVDRPGAFFTYYYGFIDLLKEDGEYHIVNMDYYGENYLCAPYHRWDYDAEAVVDIEYGNWCSLVKERYPTQKDGYIKRIFFKGTDGKDYLIEFFELTNNNDIEIAQYMKGIDGRWKIIKIDPYECLDKKNK